LSDTGHAIGAGSPIGSACEAATATLLAAGFGSVDYVEVRDAATLASVSTMADAPLRLLAAARLGATRLIDTVAIPVMEAPPSHHGN
jgi:pantoate--beta-alanine ligase